MNSSKFLATSLALSTLAITAEAGIGITVKVTGIVEYNQINSGVLGQFMPADTVTLEFELDSDDYVDSLNFPTRGYPIDESSFVLASGSNQIGIQNPFPGTPYFSAMPLAYGSCVMRTPSAR